MHDEQMHEAVARDEAFCAAVWDALKCDHTDLRKQQIILQAHRTAIAAIWSIAMERASLWHDAEAARIEALIDVSGANDGRVAAIMVHETSAAAIRNMELPK